MVPVEFSVSQELALWVIGTGLGSFIAVLIGEWLDLRRKRGKHEKGRRPRHRRISE